MKTLDFARAQIRFDKSSPITGPFRAAPGSLNPE
jgi:hypothetical protein